MCEEGSVTGSVMSWQLIGHRNASGGGVLGASSLLLAVLHQSSEDVDNVLVSTA